MNRRQLILILPLLMLLTLLAGCKTDPTLDTLPPETKIPTEAEDVTETTEAPSEFDISIAPAPAIPAVKDSNNITPTEFADVLLVENRSPFTSQFMECEPEDFDRVDDAYALGVTNISDTTIADLTLVYSNGSQNLTFYVEMLPAGWTVVPMDTEGTTVTDPELTYVSGEINYLTEGLEVTSQVELTETRVGTIIVKNISEETIPCAVVYYRDVDYLGNMMAGRCFKAYTGELIPGWQEELETEQWLPSCVIVNVVVLDEIPEEAE